MMKKMRKDYNFLCIDDQDGEKGDEIPNAMDNVQSDSSANSNNTSNYIVALLYFFNQRPGIFVAPYLLLRGVSESKIGIVLFVSSMVALTLQTPAGQIVDELHDKTKILIIGNIATMIGCMLLSLVSTDIFEATIAVTLNVVSDAFIYPSLYAITLGIFGSDGMEKQSPLNETGTHSGNATFALIAGLVVFLASNDASFIFYICIAMRLFSIFLILRVVKTYHIDIKRSRGFDVNTTSTNSKGNISSGVITVDLEDSRHTSENSEGRSDQPLGYLTLLMDKHVIVFLVSIMLFHFANAAMLPLLSQQLFKDNEEKGFAFAAGAVITAQVSMVGSAAMSGWLVSKTGTKPLFILALLAIPLRGVIIVLLLRIGAGKFTSFLLLSTQILDGLAGGIIGLLLVLITENLARGSGRFAMLLGLAKTAEGIGASFSNLVGEYLAEYRGYAFAFFFLSGASLVPVILYSLGMPAAVKCEAGDNVRMFDNLSVASSHGVHLGVSDDSFDNSQSSTVRMRRSFGTNSGATYEPHSE